MSKLGWFLAGIGIGALGLSQYRDNPQAREAVDEVVTAAKDFSASIAEGYQEREAELKSPKKRATPKK
jgi:uncharacterized protein (UPF0264 family)